METKEKLPFYGAMTQVDRVHQELGLTGKGVIVGIIDTGVDYNHPALGGGFGPGYKVRYGRDLVGSRFNFSDPGSIQPHKTPLDTCGADFPQSGHGTHVAGIIGAYDTRYNFTGVAPNATLGMWRIFGCSGSTTNDLVIEALIQAYETGCQIINLSLGSPSNWPEEPSAIVADRIAGRGVSGQKHLAVVVAAGNEGADGAFMISTPSTGDRVVSAASVDNDYVLEKTLSPDTADEYPYILSSSTAVFPNGTLVAFSNGTSADGCTAQANGQLRGAIALVERGQCEFDVKAQMAAAAGAIGVLIYDNAGNDAFAATTLTAQIPVAACSHATGQRLLQLLQGAGGAINITFNQALSAVAVSTSRQVSGFSSTGPTDEIGFKPDIAGVGGFVFSTLPLVHGGYGTLSGTSMASPFISGVHALYRQAHTNSKSLYINEQFQNYALPAMRNNRTDSPVRQGAGLIQAYDAIVQKVHVSPGHISFNDTIHRTEHTLTISNHGNLRVSYTIQNTVGLTVAPYNTTQQDFAPLQPAGDTQADGTADIYFSTVDVTIEPGETASVTVRVSDVKGSVKNEPYPIFGGYIQLNPLTPNTKILRVPYIGIQGDVSQLPVFDVDFPSLSSPSEVLVVGGQTNNKTAHTIQRSTANNFLIVLYRLLTGTAHMTTEVLDQNQREVGIASTLDFLSRNTMNQDNFASSSIWNGTVLVPGTAAMETTPLKDGVYYLRWKALRLLADPKLQESWEIRTSPPITISS
ncbi:hypothetical protein DFQ28_003159 [Apophysomyces sp. BC1034]|nr:hypothetical protein DFQ28_003159 [Apophysomyces sp. BC1034]